MGQGKGMCGIWMDDDGLNQCVWEGKNGIT